MNKKAHAIPGFLISLILFLGCDADQTNGRLSGNSNDTDDTNSDNGTGEGEGEGEGTEDSTDDCYENLDIVFVLDVSTTMGFILSTLRDEIGLVWEKAQEIDNEPHFGLVVFVDDVTLVSSQTYTSVDQMQADFETWYQHTSGNDQTASNKTNIDFPENSLDALWTAATDYEWRPQETTLRIAIHATDDTFKEAPEQFEGSIPAMHTYSETVQQLQDQYIRVATFAATLGGSSGNTDVSGGFLGPYNGQPSIPEATGGSAFDIEQVGDTISLADAINEFVTEELCTPYAPI